VALKKPTDLFGVQKVSQIVEEINKFETLEETHELTGGNPGGNFSVSFSASMIDEIFKNLQVRIEKSQKEDIQGVYEELRKCKKLVNTSQLKVEGRVNTLKKELYERIDEHIAHAQQTIQELYHTEIRQIKKLSHDIQLVEKYITTHSKKIVELKSQINEELQKRPIAIDRIESKIDLVAESYQNLTENLDEGLLNEPVTADAVSNTEFVTSDQLKDHYRLFLNRIEEQLSTVGGGGEVNLKYLDDVVGVATNAAAYDDKFLKYNHTAGKFEFSSNTTSKIGINTTNSDYTFQINSPEYVPTPSSETFTITTQVAAGNTAWIVSGNDREGSFSNEQSYTDSAGTAYGKVITIYEGDTIIFNNSLFAQHPLKIVDYNNQLHVNNPAASGQGTATVTWIPQVDDVYVYQCGIHTSAMRGWIFVDNPPAPVDNYENVFLVHPSGEVGIGTTTLNNHPNGKLSVGGSIQLYGNYGNIEFVDSSVNRDSTTGIRWHESGAGSTTRSSWDNNARFTIDYNGSFNAPSSGMLEFTGYSFNTNNQETYAVITREGNVGVGSTRPRSSVDVNGDVSVGISSVHGVILTSPNNTRFRIIVDNSGNLTTAQI
jgi:plastocyanin